jgi:tRNA G10  N-methylase Trm11
MRQKSIFDDIVINSDRIDEKIVYSPISNKSATFKSGTNKKIHNWFRLTPSFGPDLVDIMLEKLQYQRGEVVLDPFGGASTTLIQCKLNRIDSIGFEINPLLHFVGKTSLNWSLEPTNLETSLLLIERIFKGMCSELSKTDLENCGFELPTIHNVFRWWRRDVLKDLLILKHIIKTANLDQPNKDFFLLGLVGVLVPDLTNVTLGKLQLHFIDRNNDVINVFESFKKHIETMISDLKIIRSEYGIEFSSSDLFLTDSTDIKHINFDSKADLVITSPPYPNRYSYVWNTRPHLYFLDIFNDAKQASSLDCKTIGGTWGVATSNLMKGIIEPSYPIINEVVEPIVSKIRETDNLMANYVMKYFNMLAKQIIELEEVASDKFRVGYVVGNSEIKGVYIETDLLLGKIFEGIGLGYHIKEITRFRKRNSGVNLYESIVYASK